MSSEDPYTTLMTGATGFLGHFVLRELLIRGHRVVAVLRPPLAETARRLSGMMEPLDLDPSPFLDRQQLVLVEGALPDNLPEPDWGRTHSILNCAGSLQLFSNGNADPFETNVTGTEALIEWAIRHGVTRIQAVSTAYTCGWNSGVIRETFHSPAPAFQTDYERSKWKAESLLEQWASWLGHCLTLFRPSFLVGDSTTGHTTQFGGFYQFARLVSTLKERFCDPKNGDGTHIPLRIPGRPEDPQNIVPVDFVSQVIAEVVVNPAFHGRIYHLTNPQPPTNAMMKRCYEEYFGLRGGYFADPQEVVGKYSLAESLLWDQYHLITPRVVHNPLFDITNTRAVMEAANLEFPVLNRERIFRLFDYARRHGWGRQSIGFHS